MLKTKLISLGIKILMGGIAIGIGIWYLSYSLGDAKLGYTDTSAFMNAINANGNMAETNGCFLCGYITDLFNTIGNAAEIFWSAIVNNLWLLMVLGVGIYILIHAIQYLFERMKANASYSDKKNDLDFEKWVEPVWKLVVRVLLVATAIGALSMGGIDALKIISEIIISPVLYVGATLASATTNAVFHSQCPIMDFSLSNGVMAPIAGSFRCVIGNLNTIILAGAAGGFSLMNFSWMGLGGGIFTWLSGLGLVLMFLIIGFDLFFQILTVIFKLIFIVIFLPILLAAFAFEKVWKLASELFKNAIIKVLVPSAVRIVAVTLKIVILLATIDFVADATFPGGTDGYNAVLPPLLEQSYENVTPQNSAVMSVFQTCDSESMIDGERSADAFKQCFLREKTIIESEHPGAFDFMRNGGWEFLMLAIGLMFLYYYVISPKIDKLLPAGNVKLSIPNVAGEESDAKVDTKGEEFDYGAWIHDLGQKAWHAPAKIFSNVSKKLHDGGFTK